MGKKIDECRQPEESADPSIILEDGDICPMCHEKVRWEHDEEDPRGGDCRCRSPVRWVDFRGFDKRIVDDKEWYASYRQYFGRALVFARCHCQCPDSKCDCKNFADTFLDVGVDGDVICNECHGHIYIRYDSLFVCGKRTKDGTECPTCHCKLSHVKETTCACGVTWDPKCGEVDVDVERIMEKAGL